MKYGVSFTEGIYIPGDERSRTNPGHGYPAYTHNYTEFKEFDSEEALMSWLESYEDSKKDLKIYRLEELAVEKTVTRRLK